MKVEIGVIAAAGAGTRMLPVTLGYPKELLPIINKPAIHLIVEEYIDSGIKKIVIVTGENPDPLHRQYDLSGARKLAKHNQLDEFVEKLDGIEIIFEPQKGPYGNGTPLRVARPHIPDGEGFIYSYGDDIIKSKTPFTRRLIEKHNRTGGLIVGTQEVAWEDVERYGIVELKPGGTVGEMVNMVEKPKREEAPSNLAVFGRFLLSVEVIQIVAVTPRGKNGELWLTDGIREYIKRGGTVFAQPVEDGEWLTIGDPANYLKTLIEYVMDDEELRAAIEPRLRKRLSP